MTRKNVQRFSDQVMLKNQPNLYASITLSRSGAYSRATVQLLGSFDLGRKATRRARV